MTISAQASPGQTPARLTTTEFAMATGLSTRKVRELIRGGFVTVIRLPGSRQLIPASEAERLIREATRPAATVPAAPAEGAASGI